MDTIINTESHPLLNSKLIKNVAASSPKLIKKRALALICAFFFAIYFMRSWNKDAVKKNALSTTPYDIKNGCVEQNRIDMFADLTRTAYENGLRIFPRNGFLLGVIRHQGFLPHEKLDADLACMHEDAKKFDEKFSLKSSSTGNEYHFERNKTNSSNWPTFNGKDPFSSMEYPFDHLKIYVNGKWEFTADSIFPYRNEEVYYPLWATDFNLNGSLLENKRYRKTGGTTFVLRHHEKELKEVLDNIGDLSIGTIFNEESVHTLIAKKFYNTTILVPKDAEEVLNAFYGTSWKIPDKRVAWEAKSIDEKDQNDILESVLPVCIVNQNIYNPGETGALATV